MFFRFIGAQSVRLFVLSFITAINKLIVCKIQINLPPCQQRKIDVYLHLPCPGSWQQLRGEKRIKISTFFCFRFIFK